MSLGAITQINVNPRMTATEPQGVDAGPLKMIITQFTADSAYAPGGTVLTPAQLGFGTDGVVYWANVQVVATTGSNSGAVDGAYNLATGKLQMFQVNALSGASYVQNAVGPLIEAANAGNLSGLTLQVCAFGTPGA